MPGRPKIVAAALGGVGVHRALFRARRARAGGERAADARSGAGRRPRGRRPIRHRWAAPRVVTQSSPVVVHTAPVVRPPSHSLGWFRELRRELRVARGRHRAQRALALRRSRRSSCARCRATHRVVLRSAAGLVLDEPARVATTFAVLALFAVILASGSFLGVLVEVRRNLR